MAIPLSEIAEQLVVELERDRPRAGIVVSTNAVLAESLSSSARSNGAQYLGVTAAALNAPVLRQWTAVLEHDPSALNQGIPKPAAW